MTKALFKKQMLEVFSWVYRNKKSGKNRSKQGLAAFILLYLVLFAFLGGVFYNVAGMLCAPLAGAGLGWLYFALMGLIGVALGVFGSVFSTYSTLYMAKDNDLLLSMPIPAARILLVRLSGVFAMGLLYELIVMIPTVIVYLIDAPVNALGIIFTLLIPLVLLILVLTLSCLLGWVVALVSGKLKNKNIIVVFLSLAFIAAYYYFYMKAYSMLQSILADPQTVGGSIKSVLYPFYQMGLAAQGHALSMLIFTVIVAVLFALVYLALSRSFLKLATVNRGTTKVKYKEKNARVRSADSALLHKELKRFLGSPTYMLNCGLGIVILPIAAVALLIKKNAVLDLVSAVFVGAEDVVPLLFTAALCMVTCMNDIAAPSVSLEGKNLWLVQGFPVSPWQVLKAKLKLHLILTLVPALILAICVDIVLTPAPVFAILILVATVLFILLMALIGLFLGLKMPNLNWTDESVPVKQSMSVMLALFGGWALVLALGALYFLLQKFVTPLLYLICAAAALLIASAVLLVWLKRKGTQIFERL